MSDFVSYDTGGMNSVANQISQSVSEFKHDSVDKFFDTMAEEIGKDVSHGTWNGDLAQEFMDVTINPKRQEFEKACNTVISFADNLASQSKSWESWEQGN